MKRLAWLLMVVLLAGCGTTPTPTGDQSGPMSSSPAPSISATTSAMPSDWGPLAVAARSRGDEVSVDGTIRVSDRCVFLDSQGVETLLVWPADATNWDPTSGNITYTNSDGSPQIFSDGNHLVFRGVTSTRAEGSQTNQEWAGSVPWLSPPARECLRDDRMFVDEVQIPQ